MEDTRICDTLIVGGGIAGLTAGAYLSKYNRNVILCEKENHLGGLVNTFQSNGFYFDSGLRAIEDSGITRPMLNQLGIEMEFLESPVSLGIQDQIIEVTSKESVISYQELLNRLFPRNTAEIAEITKEITRIMDYMDILYGIDNPLFMDLSDMKYISRTVMPWLFKYILTVPKLRRLYQPVDEYLLKFTDNRALVDIIAQHFFKKTPTFFALSYFSLYLDYRYPKGGTGKIVDALERFYLNHSGQVFTGTKIIGIDIANHLAYDNNGQSYLFKALLWAADLKTLYRIINTRNVKPKILKALNRKNHELHDKVGGDSVFSIYLSVDLDPVYFSRKSGAHFFYTPSSSGLSEADIKIIQTDSSPTRPLYVNDKPKIIEWLKRYLTLNTYEISIPVLRDPELAPKGQTGLVISILMDYSLVRHIQEMGWYDEFKDWTSNYIIAVLEKSVYPGLTDQVINRITSTPLTIQKITGNSDGAITGWAFTNSSIPAVMKMPKIAKSVLTPLPDIYQAGQWTYSPAGFPISVLTGKLAADKIHKKLK